MSTTWFCTNIVLPVADNTYECVPSANCSNLPEVAHKQKVLGVDGVIVDHVLEIVTVVHDLEKQQQQHDTVQEQHQTYHQELLRHQEQQIHQ